MTDAEIERIAKGLTKAQREYLLAHTGEEYFNRHGRTANWALRRGYADTLVHFSDDKSEPWGQRCIAEMDAAFRVGGQILTPLGLAVRAYLMEQPDA